MTMPEDNRSNDDYCWTRIGTFSDGDASCVKLRELIHCRNCDLFQDHAGRLLEMSPPDGYIGEWAKSLAEQKEKAVNLSESFLIFRLEDELLALPTTLIREVANPASIHTIPRKSDSVLLGLVNFRGRLQLCFSLKALLGLEPARVAENNHEQLFGTRFVQVESDGMAWVFPVDEVLDVYRYDLDLPVKVPDTVARAGVNYIMSAFDFRDRLVGRLDDELIVDSLKRRLL